MDLLTKYITKYEPRIGLIREKRRNYLNNMCIFSEQSAAIPAPESTGLKKLLCLLYMEKFLTLTFSQKVVACFKLLFHSIVEDYHVK